MSSPRIRLTLVIAAFVGVLTLLAALPSATTVVETASPPTEVVAAALPTRTRADLSPSTTTTTQPPPPQPSTTSTAPPKAPQAVVAPSAPQTVSAPSRGNGDPNDPASWDRLAQCESGGDWSINTGNGYYGGLQFSLSSWQAVGGTGYPHQASRATQIAMGQRLYAQGGWGHWPGCTRSFGWR